MSKPFLYSKQTPAIARAAIAAGIFGLFRHFFQVGQSTLRIDVKLDGIPGLASFHLFLYFAQPIYHRLCQFAHMSVFRHLFPDIIHPQNIGFNKAAACQIRTELVEKM